MRSALAGHQPSSWSAAFACFFFFALLLRGGVRLLLRRSALRGRPLRLSGRLLGRRGRLGLRRLLGLFGGQLLGRLDHQAGHLVPTHRRGLADDLALGQHQEDRMGIGPHAGFRGQPGQLGWRGIAVQPVLQVRLHVGQLGGLPVQRTRLERLVLQRRVEHQQSGHAQSEDADEHQQEREPGQPLGGCRHRAQPPSLGWNRRRPAGPQRAHRGPGGVRGSPALLEPSHAQPVGFPRSVGCSRCA